MTEDKVEGYEKPLLNAPPGYEWTSRFKDHKRTQPLRTQGVNINQKETLETPFVPDSEAGQQMGNWDKLRPWEQKALEILPGVVQKFSDSKLGKFVGESLVGADKDFNATFLGKLLYALDIPFEALERTSGLLAQQIYSEEHGIDPYSANLSPGERSEITKDMYAAGQFLSDFANLPFRKFENGEFVGFQKDTDMPGLVGVVEARNRITALRQGGMDRKDAIEEVRKTIYDEYGALSFRMQMQDLGARIFLDPLNYVLPIIKPVKRIQKASALALSTKLPRELLEVSYQAAIKSDDLVKAARFAKALEAAEASGKVMGVWDRAAIFMSGGVDIQLEMLEGLGTAPELVTILKAGENSWWAKNTMARIAGSKVPLARGMAKQLTLTPESMAYEIQSIFLRQAKNQLVGIDTVDGLETFFRNISQDIVSPKYGHAMFSIEGQVFMASVKKTMDDVVNPLINSYKVVQEEAEFLQRLARLFDNVDISSQQLLDDLFTDGLETTVKRLRNVGMSDAQENLFRGGMETFENMHKSWEATKWTDVLPNSIDHLKHALQMGIFDAIEDVATEAFGVQSIGFVRKLTEGMKAGETLAFLRLNPGYPVRNTINNTFTLLGRQLNPFVPEGKIDDLVRKLGGMPHRMAEGYGFSGETLGRGAIAAKYAGPETLGKKIAAKLRGERTFLDDVRKNINDLNIKFDMGEISRRAERHASERAFYGGYMQGMRMFWKPDVGYTSIRKAIPREILGRMGDEQIDALEHAVTGMRNSHTFGVDDISGVDEASVMFSKLTSEVEAKTGFKFNDVFDELFVDNLHDGLEEAYREARRTKDPQVLSNFFVDMKDTMQRNLDDLTDARQNLRIGFASTLVDGEQHMGVATTVADLIDDFIYTHIGHHVRMHNIDPTSLSPAARDEFWRKVLPVNRRGWKRHNQRVRDGYIGIIAGADNAKIVPGNVKGLIDDYTSVWDDFFDFRESVYDEFFTALKEKKKTSLTWDGITDTLSKRYDDIAKKEIRLLEDLDTELTAIISQSDKPTARLFADWRKASRANREGLRDATKRFMSDLRAEPDPNMRHMMWKKFQMEQVGNMQDIHKTKRAGLIAMYGDQMAGEQFRVWDAYNESMAIAVANKFKFATQADSGAKLDDVLLATVNRYLRGAYDDFHPATVRMLEDAGFAIDDIRAARKARVAAEKAAIPDMLDLSPEDIENVVRQGVELSGYEHVTFSEHIAEKIRKANPLSDIEEQYRIANAEDVEKLLRGESISIERIAPEDIEIPTHQYNNLAEMDNPEIISEALYQHAKHHGLDKNIPKEAVTIRCKREMRLGDNVAAAEWSDFLQGKNIARKSQHPKREVFYFSWSPDDEIASVYRDVRKGNATIAIDASDLTRNPDELGDLDDIYKVEIYTGSANRKPSVIDTDLDEFRTALHGQQIGEGTLKQTIDNPDVFTITDDAGKTLVSVEVDFHSNIMGDDVLFVEFKTLEDGLLIGGGSTDDALQEILHLADERGLPIRTYIPDLPEGRTITDVGCEHDPSWYYFHGFEQPDSATSFMVRPPMARTAAIEKSEARAADLVSYLDNTYDDLKRIGDGGVALIDPDTGDEMAALNFYPGNYIGDLEKLDPGVSYVEVTILVDEKYRNQFPPKSWELLRKRLGPAAEERGINIFGAAGSFDEFGPKGYEGLSTERLVRLYERIGAEVFDPVNNPSFVRFRPETRELDGLTYLTDHNVSGYFPVQTGSDGVPYSSFKHIDNAFNELASGKTIDELSVELPDWVRGKFKDYEDEFMQKMYPGDVETRVNPNKLFPPGDPLDPPKPDVRRLLGGGGPPNDEPKDMAYAMNGGMMLDDLQSRAMNSYDNPRFRFDNLNQEQTGALNGWVNQVKGEFRDASVAARKYAEVRRDMALLNYRRRYQLDNTISFGMPYAFWMTSSIQKWALSSLDSPVWVSSFMRMRKALATMGAPKEGFPNRLRDSIKIPGLAPSFLGGRYFVNPMQLALPFDQMLYPWEEKAKRGQRDERRAEQAIQQMMQAGTITSDQANEALELHSGQIWDRAIALAETHEDRDSGFDIANMFSAVHAPYVWGYKALTGQKEDIGPLTPMGRNVKKFYGLLGINPVVEKNGFGTAPWTVSSSIREQLGLHPFDKWEDYRIDRALSNMVAEGELTSHEALRLMIERDPSSPLFLEAAKRAAEQYARGSLRAGTVGEKASSVAAFLLNVAGLPIYMYPEGEEIQRQLSQDFGRAYDAYEDGDLQALRKFFDKHPEYESRLALWKEPAERIQSFLVDEIWSKWNDMPTVHKSQVSDVLGDRFQQGFLDKETRNYNAFNPDELAVYLKMMGGDPPGSLNTEVIPIEFAPEEHAYQAQAFYDIRKGMFPNYRTLQNVYFELDEGVRKKFLADNTELKQYWLWRDDYFHRNPSILPYVDDDYELKYQSPRAREEAYTEQPSLSRIEWEWSIGYSYVDMANRVHNGGYVPDDVVQILKQKAEQLGMTYKSFISQVATSK